MFLAGFLAGCFSAQAQTTTALVVTSGGDLGSNSSDWTLGYAFTTSSTVDVVALGVYDAGGDGLTESHPVGLWDVTGTLLGSTTVPAGGGTLVDGFRFVSISDLRLDPGSYVVAARMGSEFYLRGQPGPGISTGPAVAFQADRYLESRQLDFPIFSAGGGYHGWFGGNFQYVPVPEASAWATGLVFGLGALMTVKATRRRQTSSGGSRVDP